MILKALYDYYHRCKAVYGDKVPPLGFEQKTLEYVIHISKEGDFLDVLTDQECFAPRAAANKTSGVEPNILWDSAKYMLNFDGKNTIEDEPNTYCKSIIEMVDSLCSLNSTSITYIALKKFYDKREYKKLVGLNNIAKILKSKSISFKVNGNIVCSFTLELQSYIFKRCSNAPLAKCLVTGNVEHIVKTTAGVPLGMANNGKLVSFQSNQGYDSYGKEQCENAPISFEAEFAYTQALKMLKESDRNSVIQYKTEKGKIIIDRALYFWSSAQTEEKVNDYEQPLFSFCRLQDNPDDVDSVKRFFDDIKKHGHSNAAFDEKYYFMELVPTTKGRIAVSFWHETTIGAFADIVNKHFADFELVTNRRLRYDALGIVNAVSLKKEDKGQTIYDRTPNLIDSVFRSILTGRAYPESLFVAAINRIMAEQTYPDKNKEKKDYYLFLDRDAERTAIIKAYLNRYSEINNTNQKLTSMLATDYDNPGYLCGRLFAILEYTQQKANYEDSKNWKSELRSKYMNAAMSTPSTVFPAILANSEYYLEKIDNTRWLENIKQEIISKIMGEKSFPATLSLHDQGRFWVGYYHQSYELNKPKEQSNNEK